MSTKTLRKRIALVAVSAMGLGLLSVVPANAVTLLASGSSGTTVSVSASVAGGKALRVGVQSQILVTYTGPAVTAYSDETGTVSSGGYAASATVNSNMKVLTAPALSTAAVTSATTAAVLTSATTLDTNDFTANDGSSAAAPAQMGERVTNGASRKAALYTAINFTPDKAGTYTFLFWDDVDGGGTLGGATEKYTTVSFTVGSSISKIVASTVINNAPTTSATANYGAVIKVVLTDENGNATVPSGADSVKLSATGSATWKYTFVNGNGSVSGAGTSDAYLVAADFDANGAAYVGLLNATAETVTITPSIIGGLTTPTVTTTTAKFVTPTGYIATNANIAVTADVTSTVQDSVTYYTAPVGGSVSLTFTTAAASTIAQVGIVEASGVAYGDASIIGITTVTSASTSLATFSKAVGSIPGATFKVVVGGTAATYPAVGSLTVSNSATVQASLANADNTGVTVSPSAATLATGGAVSFVVTVEDSYGAARAGIAVTPSISGRNSGKQLASVITDADGKVVISYTDTNASGVASALTDTISLTTTSPLGASVTKNVTVTYVSGLTVSTVKMSTPNQAAGVPYLAVVPKAIAFADGAEAGVQDVTAVVTTSTGAVMAGLGVTWSVAGDGVAVLSTHKTTYTTSTGTATSKIYAWKAGTYTITATAGGVSATGTITFTQENAASARTVSAATEGNIVTATVKDRFGNAVKGSTIYAKIASGAGYFGNGVLSTQGDTDANGQVKFVVAGGAATVTVSNISFTAVSGTQVGQTSAPKGYPVNAATLTDTEFTAYTAGTATTAEEGVGASFDAAGVSSATVEVTSANPAESAADAAAEATDAANAATDAANAAAEAADAATAAAQDAADAVAALSTQVSEMVNALKKQITALTNLVIKIQKKVKA